MYFCPMYSKEIIKGTLKPIILKLLEQEGRMYGYEITSKVKVLTQGKIQITEGALYPLLHKLEAEGIVITEQENIGKRIRKYYLLTPEGKNLATAAIDEFLDFMITIKSILDPTANISYGNAK
ncbi:MAG: PadR family transcriptional regulator [Vicingaceae bacterium]|jgi:PadR family transcriptional regulator|nr:PadR family transcriptional regulator [Flavobacteriales bacterium]MDF1674184.1 PadR family transcriptional regulator [Vicingaceae bacterium]MCW8936591.1 PadR family transcriptional regulator [Flavobacteriales bacterium]MCW8940672.1 PadR family transcriptional regulator [Flavobacteriales bacterium]MCW8969149.1 PadR family transcriptional regulator [Flavobacteriales bacterium]